MLVIQNYRLNEDARQAKEKMDRKHKTGYTEKRGSNIRQAMECVKDRKLWQTFIQSHLSATYGP